MKTILIIEDDQTLRENTAEFLTEEGYNVIFAEDGLVGVQLAMKHLPDLILCDIMMPNMNGYDFFKTIQQIKATSTIPLVFLTAKTEREDIRTGMQLGADDYITKPFDLNELLQTIKVRLEKHDKLLQQHDEKFYALIDNPLMGVFIYQNEKFIYVNNAFAKIFSLYPPDFADLSFDDITIGEGKELTLEKIRRCLKGIQSSVQIVFEAFHKDTKKKLVVEVFASIVNYKGAPALIGNAIEAAKADYESAGITTISIADNEDSLSKREIEVLDMVCKGLSTSEIAVIMNVSQRTVDTHRANLLNKTGCKNTAELVMYAIRKKYIILE
jgi:PAS domain S-box-containing protein